MDFAEIEKLQADGAWDQSAVILTQAAKNLEIAGADFIVICTNTMHKVAPQIQRAIGIPILHIAKAVAPPSMRKSAPVINAPLSLIRSSATFATSSAVPGRPAGHLANMFL